MAEIAIPTPAGEDGRYVEYGGDAEIDGVPGTSAAVVISFLDTAGSVCSSMLPTGNLTDSVEIGGFGPVEVTCIDNGQPLVIIDAAALGRTGREPVVELNADTELKARLEALRLSCGELMGLGDVAGKNYPKMTLVSPPAQGGTIGTRSFIPHVCHESIGVLAAVTVGTAAVLAGTVAHAVAKMPDGGTPTVSVEHPSGEFSVQLELDPADPTRVAKSALIRTARLIMAGDVMIPARQRQPQSSQGARPVIIDIHGHYTTAPPALGEWRDRQVAGLDGPGPGAHASGVEDFRRRPAAEHRTEPAAAHG